LILRELLIHPCRFGQMNEFLQGMGSNLLAARLKMYPPLAMRLIMANCGGVRNSNWVGRQHAPIGSRSGAILSPGQSPRSHFGLA
jgi:hypothetical protein